jgi:hypothetical protein
MNIWEFSQFVIKGIFTLFLVSQFGEHFAAFRLFHKQFRQSEMDFA